MRAGSRWGIGAENAPMSGAGPKKTGAGWPGRAGGRSPPVELIERQACPSDVRGIPPGGGGGGAGRPEQNGEGDLWLLPGERVGPTPRARLALFNRELRRPPAQVRSSTSSKWAAGVRPPDGGALAGAVGGPLGEFLPSRPVRTRRTTNWESAVRSSPQTGTSCGVPRLRKGGTTPLQAAR